jgi:hypothetical protein
MPPFPINHRWDNQRIESGILLFIAAANKGISIMISELSNYKGFIFNLIYNAMLIGDSTRPVSGEAMFQRFRLPYSFVWHPLDVTD